MLGTSSTRESEAFLCDRHGGDTYVQVFCWVILACELWLWTGGVAVLLFYYDDCCLSQA